MTSPIQEPREEVIGHTVDSASASSSELRSELPTSSGWQPIETAPKGGGIASPTILLLTLIHDDDYHTSISIGFWSTMDSFGDDPTEGWCDWGAGLNEYDMWSEVHHPTHWMPLPEPPK